MIHPKQRIELIVEKMAHKRAGRMLQAAGVSGYTVVPALAGFGSSGMWQRDTDISGSRDMVVMITIVDDSMVKPITEELRNLLGEHIGLVTITPVNVMRPELF